MNEWLNSPTTSLQGLLLQKESLAGYNTWRVGGLAQTLYKPAGIDDLALFLQSCPENHPLICLGLGSNSLIKDAGFSGTVIITQGCLNQLELVGDTLVRVEAGVSCAKLARFCTRNHLTDGEFWAGIPGTLGGALRMNAGCFGRDTWQSVVEVETMSRRGKISRRHPSEFKVTYRHVEGLDAGEWFVAATCKLTPGDQKHSSELIKELLAHRAATQPTSDYNCGSVFRNPPDHYAAKLIESVGLKGHCIGGAEVSSKHANFIINHQGKASAHDIETLISFIQVKVHDKTGIHLVPEVHIIGDDDGCPL